MDFPEKTYFASQNNSTSMNPTKSPIIQIHDLSFQPFLSEEQIQERIQVMGKELAQQFASKNPLFVGVLNGAFIFMADLIRACPIDCEINFVRLNSYDGTQSSGTIATVLGLNQDIEGRHLIVVEDIIDTGTTMKDFLAFLQTKKPASITIVTLLFKPDALKYPIPIDYTGFEIPNKFVVGYGLDYNEQGRNLSNIYQLLSP